MSDEKTEPTFYENIYTKEVIHQVLGRDTARVLGLPDANYLCSVSLHADPLTKNYRFYVLLSKDASREELDAEARRRRDE